MALPIVMPLTARFNDPQEAEAFQEYARLLSDYLLILEQRLFSEGLHTLGHGPTGSETEKYLEAYFGDQMPIEVCMLFGGILRLMSYCSSGVLVAASLGTVPRDYGAASR